MTVTHTNDASVCDKWSELRFRTLYVDLVVVTDTWLWPGEGANNLTAQDYSFFIMDRTDGRIDFGTLILVA